MHNSVGEHRAVAPQIPEATRGLERLRAEFQSYRTGRERLERRSALRGLIVLAVAVLLGSIARAGLDRVFVQGWWKF